MRVHVSQLAIGDRLTADVFNHHGTLILSEQQVLDTDDIEKLKLHQIEYVEIEYRNIEKTDARTPTKIIEKIQPSFNDAVSGVKDLFEQSKMEGKFDDKQVKTYLNPLVENFKHERDVVALLIELNNKDDYTYQHSVQVGMISYFIAKWLGKSDQEAYMVGKAGYLHDIGKSRIDAEILQKPGKLSEAEFEEIKRHTLYGYEMIKTSIGEPILYMTALQHHERLDGSGYPYGALHNQIHPTAKIVAVADIYSAMISSRAYQKKRDLLYVLKELYRLSFSNLDPVITHTFIRNMIPNFIGKRVIFKSGESGTIIMNNYSDFFRPLIQLDDDFIDLSKTNEYEIETIIV